MRQGMIVDMPCVFTVVTGKYGDFHKLVELAQKSKDAGQEEIRLPLKFEGMWNSICIKISDIITPDNGPVLETK